MGIRPKRGVGRIIERLAGVVNHFPEKSLLLVASPLERPLPPAMLSWATNQVCRLPPSNGWWQAV